jgi:hypothetical protein
MKEIFKKVYIKSAVDLPKDILIHVGSKNGFEELVYIENGQVKKPFRYDDEDTPTLSIDKITWYLQPISDSSCTEPECGIDKICLKCGVHISEHPGKHNQEREDIQEGIQSEFDRCRTLIEHPKEEQDQPKSANRRTKSSIIKSYIRRTDDGLHYLTVRDAEKAMEQYHKRQLREELIKFNHKYNTSITIAQIDNYLSNKPNKD